MVRPPWLRSACMVQAGSGWSPLDSDAGRAGEHLDTATAVRPIQPQRPADLDLDSWASSFQGGAEQAQLFLDLHRSDPEAAHRLAEAVLTIPEIGTELL